MKKIKTKLKYNQKNEEEDEYQSLQTSKNNLYEKDIKKNTSNNNNLKKLIIY